MPKLSYLIPLVAALIGLPHAQAQEVRQINRIATPTAAPIAPAGARAVASVHPVSAAKVEDAVKQIMAAWNTPRLTSMLADNFYDKSRLADVLTTNVPRDASLRIMAVQSHRLIDQFRNGPQLVSKVSVVVRTQVEFNDAARGFRRLDGTNEYVITISEAAP